MAYGAIMMESELLPTTMIPTDSAVTASGDVQVENRYAQRLVRYVSTDQHRCQQQADRRHDRFAASASAPRDTQSRIWARSRLVVYSWLVKC